MSTAATPGIRIGLDATEPRPEPGTQHVGLGEWNPVTRPLPNITTIRRDILTGDPPLGRIIVQQCELEEVPLVRFRFGWPHVVPLDPEGAHDAGRKSRLLPYFTNDGICWHFTRLDRPRRHLNTRYVKRHVIMREDK